MRSQWKEVAAAVLMGFVVPGIMLNLAYLLSVDPVMEPEPTAPSTQVSENAGGYTIDVLFGDRVSTVDLEEYLVGVVLGEMPASFELEALKAQAVVARTYTLRRQQTGNKHSQGDVCVNSGCCQAYRDPASYPQPELLDKVRSAVEATAGLVLTYQGKLIEATYFSSAGGWTEDAAAVWGSDLPYLQATPSPEVGYEDQYLRTVSMTPEAFASALGRELTGNPETWFGTVGYTNGGGVETMVIAGVTYQGTQLRSKLGLRSTAFTVGVYDGMIHITTLGYGHRVGMSQYGAEAMAVAGSDYGQILAYYYQGTVLEEFIDIG